MYKIISSETKNVAGITDLDDNISDMLEFQL